MVKFDIMTAVEVACREQQVDLLQTLMGKPEHWVIPAMFIYGHTGTGKSLVVNKTISQFPHAVVNCVECYTPRLMYEHILGCLSFSEPLPENNYSTHSRCDNMNDFVKNLKQLMSIQEITQTTYLVFDKAERLRDMDMNLLPAFLRLQELTGLNICCILLSELVWEKFRSGTGVLEPLVIHFPDYSREDILEILVQDCPEIYPQDFYRNYISLVMSVFYSVCRSITELRHLGRLNFPKYVEPVLSGEATMTQTPKLWRHVEPVLRKALATVYLREVSSAQWERMQQEATDIATPTTPSASVPSTNYRANVELPFYSKYLLIAAYLASYNPAKTDTRFFKKRDVKMTKRAQLAQMKRNERTSNQLLGPKQFPLDRLMAIFYSIVEGRVAPTANIFSQISSLATLGLMTQMTTTDPLEAPKYKCMATLDLIKSIGRTVSFDVPSYLYDLL